jgi:hypothetical protein
VRELAITHQEIEAIAEKVAEKLMSANPGVLDTFVRKDVCAVTHKSIDDKLGLIYKLLVGISIGVTVGVILALVKLI